MRSDTNVHLNQRDCDNCLTSLASHLETVMTQKILADSYTLSDGHYGLLYDEAEEYLSALCETAGKLHVMMENYRSFIGNVVSGYREVDGVETL